MNWKLIPHSKATNSYDLLNDVCRAMREEPKRVNFGDWLSTESAKHMYAEAPEPACGTVGCIAGWCAILKAPDASLLRQVEDCTAFFSLAFRNGTVSSGPRAAALSLFPESLQFDAERLFYGSAPYTHLDREAGAIGTRQHARYVIRHIRQFQQKHKNALKAHAISRYLEPVEYR